MIVEEKFDCAKVFANLLKQGALKTGLETIYTGSQEAEVIKLFANSYFALCVAFFNELDSYVLSIYK